MKNKFTSKEIHFLKTDSDELTIKAPETYFSDLLLKKNSQIKNFEHRLLNDETIKSSFMCAVMQISTPRKSIITHEDSKTAFEEIFNSILENNNKNDHAHKKIKGLWEKINDTSFIIAFWNLYENQKKDTSDIHALPCSKPVTGKPDLSHGSYKNEEKTLELIVSFKKKISSVLAANTLVGVAKFPFHSYSKKQTCYNAFKAIDHAAFFGHDALINFDTTSLNISGDRLYHLNKFTLAYREYERGLEIEPDNINIINSLGVCFGVSGELDKAKNQFEKAHKLNPNELMVLYNIGLLYKIQKDSDNAIIYLQKAHLIDSSIFEVEFLLGSLLFKKKLPKQALPHLETAARIDPESGATYRIKGEIYLNDNRYNKACIEFNKAIKINSKDSVSLSGYAKSLESQDKNLKIALSFAQNSIKLEPDNKLFQKRLKTIQKKICQGISTTSIPLQ